MLKKSKHIIPRFCVMVVQKVQKHAQKIKFSSKVAKFAGTIGIDLTIIFCMNDFFCVILSFWDMIDFKNFVMHSGLSRNKKEIFLVRDFAPTGAAHLEPVCFSIQDPSRNRLASTAYFAKLATLSLCTVTTVKYKIDHNSKTKSRKKKTHEYSFPT